MPTPIPIVGDAHANRLLCITAPHEWLGRCEYGRLSGDYINRGLLATPGLGVGKFPGLGSASVAVKIGRGNASWRGAVERCQDAAPVEQLHHQQRCTNRL